MGKIAFDRKDDGTYVALLEYDMVDNFFYHIVIPMPGGFHKHDFHEMVIVWNGSSKIMTPNAVCSAEGSYVIFYPRGVKHSQFNRSGVPYQHSYLYFPPALLSDIGVSLSSQTVFLMDEKTKDLVETYYSLLYDVSVRPDERGTLTATDTEREKYLLALILNEISASTRLLLDRKGENEAFCQVRDICLFVDGHYGEDISIELICQTFFISRAKLVRIFRNVLGMTFHGYLTDVRLKNAVLMLGEGLSVKEISARCGFSDAGYFIRVFRQKFGVTPSKYRS